MPLPSSSSQPPPLSDVNTKAHMHPTFQTVHHPNYKTAHPSVLGCTSRNPTPALPNPSILSSQSTNTLHGITVNTVELVASRDFISRVAGSIPIASKISYIFLAAMSLNPSLLHPVTCLLLQVQKPISTTASIQNQSALSPPNHQSDKQPSHSILHPPHHPTTRVPTHLTPRPHHHKHSSLISKHTQMSVIQTPTTSLTHSSTPSQTSNTNPCYRHITPAHLPSHSYKPLTLTPRLHTHLHLSDQSFCSGLIALQIHYTHLVGFFKPCQSTIASSVHTHVHSLCAIPPIHTPIQLLS